ncbi:DUF305 domain-containing protein [Streptomyces sp. SID13031]|uniref:DUF305 domain-containing protein n=1 Tax=Streptomyces sp. SID13031 TaxID=2706046 RepID=UPI0013CDCBDD|nr:DUF305 domain-containing protein [Streptomyces sp. SID13031]
MIRSSASGANHGSKATGPSTSLPPAPAPAGGFNDADVTFATQMIPHHQQAVQMATMAARKATTAEVKKLSTAIKAAQDPEIKTLSGWLTSMNITNYGCRTSRADLPERFVVDTPNADELRGRTATSLQPSRHQS